MSSNNLENKSKIYHLFLFDILFNDLFDILYIIKNKKENK
jgi:hypothetical protein